jgi:hypothetical protein
VTSTLLRAWKKMLDYASNAVGMPHEIGILHEKKHVHKR